MRVFSSYGWAALRASITHSPLRQLFFFFAIVQCSLQVVLRAAALVEDVSVIAITNSVFDRLPATDIVRDSIATIQGQTVFACHGLLGAPDRMCMPIASINSSVEVPVPDNYRVRRHEVQANLPSSVEATCERAMLFPHTLFSNAEREDAVLMLFQAWLFVLAVTGLFQDSVPHIAAHIGGQLINAVWAVFRFQLLLTSHRQYEDYVVQAACGDVDVLGGMWNTRNLTSIAILASNSALAFISAYISIKLIRRFMQTTYSRVGTSSEIARVYRWALAYSMALHGGFFIATSFAIWISKIAIEPLTDVVPACTAQLVVAAVAIAIVPLWMLMGWKSICLECGHRFTFFCIFSCLLAGAFCAMFASPAFSAIIATFPFFAALSVLSCVYLIAAAALGVVCRFQFGHGLAHFIEVQAVLARDGFAATTFSHGASIRDESSAFGQGSLRTGSLLFEDLGIDKKPLFLLPNGVQRASFVPLAVPITDTEHGSGLPEKPRDTDLLAPTMPRPPPAALPRYFPKRTARQQAQPKSFLSM